MLVAWHWQKVYEGICSRNPEIEISEVSGLHNLEDPGSRSPRETVPPWGHSAISPSVLAEPAQCLLQTHLGGLCSQWSLSAAIGTWVACECVRAGGMEDAGAVKGVEKVMSCHKSIVLGIKWVGKVV